MTPPHAHAAGDGPGSARDGMCHIRDLTQAALRTVVAERQRGRSRSAAITDGVRDACDAAHAEGLHAEQLIVIVKDCWHHLPDRQVLEHTAAAEALQVVVGMCITEFYRGARRA